MLVDSRRCFISTLSRGNVTIMNVHHVVRRMFFFCGPPLHCRKFKLWQITCYFEVPYEALANYILLRSATLGLYVAAFPRLTSCRLSEYD